jgi:hypothetical protein
MIEARYGYFTVQHLPVLVGMALLMVVAHRAWRKERE